MTKSFFKGSRRMLATAVLAAVFTVFTVGAQAPGQVRIAMVDMKKAFDGFYKTKQAEGQIKERAGDSDKSYKGMIEDYKKANEEYKKLMDVSNDQAVSSDERDKRKKSAEGKLMELQEIEKSIKQFETQARSTLAEMEKRMRDKIVGEIREVVNVQAKAGGFSLVLDSAAVTPYQTPIILFTTGENDLTEAVLREINANAPAGAFSTAAEPEKAPPGVKKPVLK